MNEAEKNLRFADVLVGTLAAAGVRHFVVSPGSRSTTLATAVSRCEGISTHIHLDERGAAFLAQGAAKASGAPTVLVCTSGTAAANYLPAIVEANFSGIPLVILTSDRPAELRDCGAPQVIDQLKLYGSNVRWFHEAALPGALEAVDDYARSIALRALSFAAGSEPGPVHLNLSVREPFLPERLPPAPVLERIPPPTVRVLPSEQSLMRAARWMASESHGLIVAGPLPIDDRACTALRKLSEKSGYPILADAASGVRFGPSGGARIIVHADAFLRSPEIAESLRPGIVLRLGQMPSSKTIVNWLDRSGARQIVVGEGRVSSDPTGRAALRLQGTLSLVLEELYACAPDAASVDTGWCAWLSEIDLAAGEEIDATLQDNNQEPAWGRAIVEALPTGANLFVSSSMPIRDVDWFSAPREEPLHVFANRGANGIDGVVSSALGVGLATGRPTFLLTGDLALLHDLGSLASAVAGGWPLSIIVFNNDGGGIFEMLPVARHDRLFERYFKTPHGLCFERIAQAFGAAYENTRSLAALRPWLKQEAGGLHILEIPVDSSKSKSVREQAWERATERVRTLLPTRRMAL